MEVRIWVLLMPLLVPNFKEPMKKRPWALSLESNEQRRKDGLKLIPLPSLWLNIRLPNAVLVAGCIAHYRSTCLHPIRGGKVKHELRCIVGPQLRAR